MAGLGGVDTVCADKVGERAALEELCPQVDQLAAERAAQLRDECAVILLPAVQVIGVAEPAENVFRVQPLRDVRKIPVLLQRRQGGHRDLHARRG